MANLIRVEIYEVYSECHRTNRKIQRIKAKKVDICRWPDGDNFLRFHGNFTESESPKIPIIQSIDEISELYQSRSEHE